MRLMMTGLALGAALAGSSAGAATVSFTGEAFGSGLKTFEVGWFDTTLGTLTSAWIDVLGSAEANAFDFDFDGQTATATAIARVEVKFAFETFSETASDTQSCTAPVNGDCDVQASAFADLFESYDVDPYDFDDVSGPGAGSFSVTAFFEQGGYVDVSVTYTYDAAVAPVPLPAAGGLLVAGLGGLGLLRRRRAA